MEFKDKVKEGRAKLGMTQKQLAEKMGVSHRTVTSYEQGERRPYPAQCYKLAVALGVSTEYLEKDEIEDPNYGSDRMEYVEETRQISGNKEAKSLEQMLKDNQALFAGGEISEEAKDAYFQALTLAYADCKKAAKEKYGKKKEVTDK